MSPLCNVFDGCCLKKTCCRFHLCPCVVWSCAYVLLLYISFWKLCNCMILGNVHIHMYIEFERVYIHCLGGTQPFRANLLVVLTLSDRDIELGIS